MKNQKSYKMLSEELGQIIAWFDNEDVDIEESIDKYKQAQSIIAELKKRLDEAELTIKKIA